MHCPYLKECGHPLCVAASVARIPNELDLREYCLTAHAGSCPYFAENLLQDAATPARQIS